MSKPQDIFIFIEGYVKEADQGKDNTTALEGAIGQRFNTPVYTNSHQPIQWISYIGGSKNDPSSSIAERVFKMRAPTQSATSSSPVAALEAGTC